MILKLSDMCAVVWKASDSFFVQKIPFFIRFRLFPEDLTNNGPAIAN
jgi:hypothetical protein